MLTDEIRTLLQQAGMQLSAAEAELNRPLEDVVALSACQLVRDAVRHIMEGYLETHDLGHDDQMTIDELHFLCTTQNPLFTRVDLAGIECKCERPDHCRNGFCGSVEDIAGCVNAVNQMRSLVQSELNFKF